MSTPPSASDPPLAYGEELTHTNADLSHMILDGLHATATAPSRPPRRLPVVTRATRFAPSRDPGEDGLVRVEVLALGPREIGGLAIDELRVELFETKGLDLVKKMEEAQTDLGAQGEAFNLRVGKVLQKGSAL